MKIVQIDANTGEFLHIEADQTYDFLEDIRQSKINETIDSYKVYISNGFSSDVTGASVKYRYKEIDQLNYSKWANVLALNPNATSVSFETDSDGFITLTREQFIALMAEIQTFEMDAFNKRMAIESRINSAQSVDDLLSIDTTQ